MIGKLLKSKAKEKAFDYLMTNLENNSYLKRKYGFKNFQDKERQGQYLANKLNSSKTLAREINNYSNERTTIKNEVLENREKADYKLQERLYNKVVKDKDDPTFSEKRIVGRIWEQKEQLGITKPMLNDYKTVQKAIAKQFKNELTDNMTFEVSEGKNKGQIRTINSFFKNVSELNQVEKLLNDIQSLMENDQKAILNKGILLSYLYNDILYELYEGTNAQFERGQGKDNPEFWREVGRRLKAKYKSIHVPIKK